MALWGVLIKLLKTFQSFTRKTQSSLKYSIYIINFTRPLMELLIDPLNVKMITKRTFKRIKVDVKNKTKKTQKRFKYSIYIINFTRHLMELLIDPLHVKMITKRPFKRIKVDVKSKPINGFH